MLIAATGARITSGDPIPVLLGRRCMIDALLPDFLQCSDHYKSSLAVLEAPLRVASRIGRLIWAKFGPVDNGPDVLVLECKLQSYIPGVVVLTVVFQQWHIELSGYERLRRRVPCSGGASALSLHRGARRLQHRSARGNGLRSGGASGAGSGSGGSRHGIVDSREE